MKVKSALLGLASASGGLLMSANVASADGYSAPRAYAPVNTWTGCYVGIQGGWAGGHSQHNLGTTNTVAAATTIAAVFTPSFTTTPIASFDMEGWLIGGTSGCNLQTGSIVIGVESDISWTDKRGKAFDLPPFNTAFTSATREQWLSTTRLRLGHAWGPVLLYGTIGAAFVDAEMTACGTLSCSSQNKWRIGLAYGAGVEWAVAHGWSAKVEYLHIDFENQQYFTPPLNTTVTTFLNRTGGVWLNDDLVRVGLNYRFGDRKEVPLK